MCRTFAVLGFNTPLKNISIQKLYEETGWEKLLERRGKHQLILLYKIVNNQAPGYLKKMLPDRVDNRHYQQLRSGHFRFYLSNNESAYPKQHPRIPKWV
jgi:hypothetical protein